LTGDETAIRQHQTQVWSTIDKEYAGYLSHRYTII